MLRCWWLKLPACQSYHLMKLDETLILSHYSWNLVKIEIDFFCCVLFWCALFCTLCISFPLSCLPNCSRYLCLLFFPDCGFCLSLSFSLTVFFVFLLSSCVVFLLFPLCLAALLQATLSKMTLLQSNQQQPQVLFLEKELFSAMELIEFAFITTNSADFNQRTVESVFT